MGIRQYGHWHVLISHDLFDNFDELCYSSSGQASSKPQQQQQQQQEQQYELPQPDYEDIIISNDSYQRPVYNDEFRPYRQLDKDTV